VWIRFDGRPQPAVTIGAIQMAKQTLRRVSQARGGENEQTGGAPPPGLDNRCATARPAKAKPKRRRRKLDPNLHMEIRLTLQDKAKAMLQEMKRDPKSEAGQMVYILLVNELATMKGRLSQKDLKSVFDQEQRRYNLIKTVELQRSTIALQDRKLRQTTLKMNQGDAQLGAARDVATLTQHRLEEGKEVDMRSVCRRISEIVGLRSPAFAPAPATPPEESGSAGGEAVVPAPVTMGSND
jgi:translation initiation factor 2 beta subunit (eIF-2beta)/eIF-5